MALSEEERKIANGEMERNTAPRNKKSKTPDQLRKETRDQIAVISDRTGKDVSDLIVPVVGEQIAVNVIQNLPDSIQKAGELLDRFFTGISILEGENSMLPECQIDQYLPISEG